MSMNLRQFDHFHLTAVITKLSPVSFARMLQANKRLYEWVRANMKKVRIHLPKHHVCLRIGLDSDKRKMSFEIYVNSKKIFHFLGTVDEFLARTPEFYTFGSMLMTALPQVEDQLTYYLSQTTIRANMLTLHGNEYFCDRIRILKPKEIHIIKRLTLSPLTILEQDRFVLSKVEYLDVNVEEAKVADECIEYFAPNCPKFHMRCPSLYHLSYMDEILNLIKNVQLGQVVNKMSTFSCGLPDNFEFRAHLKKLQKQNFTIVTKSEDRIFSFPPIVPGQLDLALYIGKKSRMLFGFGFTSVLWISFSVIPTVASFEAFYRGCISPFETPLECSLDCDDIVMNFVKKRLG